MNARRSRFRLLFLQSSGKTSVVESLVGADISVKDQAMATRHLQPIQAPHESCLLAGDRYFLLLFAQSVVCRHLFDTRYVEICNDCLFRLLHVTTDPSIEMRGHVEAAHIEADQHACHEAPRLHQFWFNTLMSFIKGSLWAQFRDGEKLFTQVNV